MGFNLDDYEPVEDRLKKFWQEHPDGRIETRVVATSEGNVIVEAYIFLDDGHRIKSSGISSNKLNQTGKGAQATHPVEDAETSAIGRALANWVYASADKPRPSRQEMARVSGTADTAEERVSLVYLLDGWEDERKDALRDEWDFPFSILDVPERSRAVVTERIEAVAMRDLGDIVEDLAEKLHAEFQESLEPF